MPLDPDTLLEGLTPPQREAVTHVDGPLLILAAAGSGKTRVITRRVAHLLSLGIPPWSILALTFTNKAAQEMRERIGHLLEHDPRLTRGLTVTTFHALCARLLRRYADAAGLKTDYTIYDTSDQLALVKKLIADLDLSTSNWPPRSVLSAISTAKNDLLDADAFAARAGDFYAKQIARMYSAYEKALRAANAVDFDDLLMLTASMLRADDAVRGEVQHRWQYLLIDEYQDTNRAQFEIARLIAGEPRAPMPGLDPEGPNICVVGDPDQCLLPGTMIRTATGSQPIESLRDGDAVLAATGWGSLHPMPCDKVMHRHYAGPVVRLHTADGSVITATPNHQCFAKLRADPDLHYTYLMWKRGIGFRIGTTRGVRASKDGEIVSGLQVRTNQEVADAMWILHSGTSAAEARYFEHLYSVRYGIPTMVFFVRGRRMEMTQDWIDRLYATVDTEAAAARLMQDLHLDRSCPHHRPGGVTRDAGPQGAWSRRRIHCVVFGDGRKLSTVAWRAHRVQLVTSDRALRQAAEGRFRVREGVRGTWRIETSRQNYDDAFSLAKDIATLDPELELVVRARLTSDRAFSVMPISHIHPGMIVPIHRDGGVAESVVTRIEWSEYDGPVYDLSVPNARNYVAQDIVVHNSIYGWRGADISNILQFEELFPGCRVIALGENFRSTAPILACADTLIKHNKVRKHKPLFTSTPGGEPVEAVLTQDEQHESRLVADWLRRQREDADLAWRDMAVFYRTNALSRVMEDALRGSGIPYIIARGTAFYDREEVKNALAYLRVVANPADDVSLLRIVNTPTRGIGKASLDIASQWAAAENVPMFEALKRAREIGALNPRAQNAMASFVALIDGLSGAGSFMGADISGSLSELVERLIRESGLERHYRAQADASKSEADAERLDNLAELVSSAAQFEQEYDPDNDPAAFPGADVLASGGSADVPPLLAMLRGYLESVALVADSDAIDPSQGAVTLMTLHAAKGLEFHAVAMVGLEEGLLPHSRALQSEPEMEEERRLCFVGITRARRRLLITAAKVRTQRGFAERTIPSRFLSELPREHCTFSDQSGGFEGGYDDDDVPSIHVSSRGASGYGGSGGAGGGGGSRSGASSPFPPGTLVRHPQFGVGRVLTISPGANARARIEFREAGVKTLVLEYARLTKVSS